MANSTYTLDGRKVSLSPSDLIGKGGEAEVFRHGAHAIKVFKEPEHEDFKGDPSAQKAARERIEIHQQKLPAFPYGLPREVIAPQKLLKDAAGKIAGYDQSECRQGLPERNPLLQNPCGRIQRPLKSPSRGLKPGAALHSNGWVPNVRDPATKPMQQQLTPTVQNTPTRIVKRDGRMVAFDSNKIRQAVRACLSHGKGLIYTPEVMERVANSVTDRILEALEGFPGSPMVEEVQDLVEIELWREGHQDAAVAYIRYREERRLHREMEASKRGKPRKSRRSSHEATFRLDSDFVKKYRDIPPPWGFGVLSELTYLRTYSRPLPDGTQEQWFQTIRRVVEGTYRMQELHIRSQDLGWSDTRAQRSAQEMYDRMFWMKFLPPGRGLWAMGSVLTEEKKLFAALNNCAYVSSDGIDKDHFFPFLFLMDMSMLGVGVGFDTAGAGKITIQEPGTGPTRMGRWKDYYSNVPESEETFAWNDIPVTSDYEVRDGVFVIPDTREGWVISQLYLLDAFFTGAVLPRFDYSQVRPANLLIKGFGGTSSGPSPLVELHQWTIGFLTSYIGKAIDSEGITTLMNLEGKCVVSGNVRRTAEIAFGSYHDETFLSLKNYRYNSNTNSYEGPRADRAAFGWTSNNSIFAKIGMDYHECAELTRVNGEPGYAWLENMRAYGRMCEPPNHKDYRVKGSNPCVEQSLEHGETCCLVENFIAKHESLEDFLRTLKFSYLYAKTVTLGKTHWAETNKVMLRNRRIGCSLAGVQQFVHVHGLHQLRQWCESGYKVVCEWDKVYSDWLCVSESIKKTSIKPGGTIPLLAGATPGEHWPENVCHIRRMRIAKGSPLLPPLRESGYHVEPDVLDSSSMVVQVPVKYDVPLRSVHQVSIWEQVAMAAFLQKYWSDNQVSCTVTFDPETEGDQIEQILNHFQYSLKGISFLPKIKGGAFAQMPYEEISEERYAELMAKLKPVQLTHINESERELERGCEGEACMLPQF